MRVTKLLSANDLGLTGSHQAGILVPKSGPAAAIFPSLDTSRLNPDCHVAFWVPALGRSWTARFVFYNNRLHGSGTRLEYRLTRISALLKELNANVGDRLVFELLGSREVHVGIEHALPRDLSEEKVLSNGWIMSVEDEENEDA